MGKQQSGVLALKIADLVKDNQLLKIARDYASDLIRIDPELTNPAHRNVAHTLDLLRKNKGIWNFIS